MTKKNLIKRILSSPLLHTFVVYVSSGWLVLELTDYLINKYNLNTKLGDILPVILLAGLPLALILAWVLSREKDDTNEKKKYRTTDQKTNGIFKIIQKYPWFSIPGSIILILLIVSGTRFLHRRTKVKWGMEDALPRIEYLINNNNYSAAFKLAQKAGRYIEDDPDFKADVEEVQNVAIDFAESQLYSLISEKNPTAVIFYLKTKGKHRGYIERIENVNSQKDPFSEMTDEEIKNRLNELRAKRDN